ncbi:MAG: hypothetical protein ACKOU6_20805, partial [Planctomycetota bacterium]
ATNAVRKRSATTREKRFYDGLQLDCAGDRHHRTAQQKITPATRKRCSAYCGALIASPVTFSRDFFSMNGTYPWLILPCRA